jgi:hypothetical protein
VSFRDKRDIGNVKGKIGLSGSTDFYFPKIYEVLCESQPLVVGLRDVLQFSFVH